MVDEVRLENAVTQLELDTARMHTVINGDGTQSATAEDGSLLPSVRKAMLDNLYFVTPPLPWVAGTINRVFNQLFSFTETDGKISWWFAPAAGQSTPVTLGASPVNSPQWRVFVDTNSIEKTYAPIESPLFTGNPRGPTPAASDSSNSLATTEFVSQAVAAVVDTTPTFETITVTGLSTLQGGAVITGDITAIDYKIDLNKVLLHGTDASVTFTDVDPSLPVSAKKTALTTNKLVTHEVISDKLTTTDFETETLAVSDLTVSDKITVTNPDRLNPVVEIEGRVKIKGPLVNENNELIGAPVDSSNFKVTENTGRQYVDYSAYTPPNGINVLKATYNPEGPLTGEPANPIVVMMSTEDNNAMRFDDGYPAYSPEAGLKVLVSKDPNNELTYQSNGVYEGLFVTAPQSGGNGLLAVRKFTNTTAAEIYTPTTGTKSILLKMIGGGGAGGNCPGAAPSIGGGGGAGAYCEHYRTSDFAGAVIEVGAGGTRTTNAGQSTVTFLDVTQLVAGAGQPGADGIASQAISLGGVGGDSVVTAPITNVLHLEGSAGGHGILFGTSALSGAGADSKLGIGGVARDSLSAPAGADGAGSLNSGNKRMGYGAGGSGAIAGSTALYRAGGSGSAGVVYIYEFG